MKTKLSIRIAWLKEAATNTGRLLIGVLLFITALFLLPFVVVAAIGFYCVTIRSKKQKAREIMVSNGSLYKRVAIGINILGNIIGGPFFNWLLLKGPSIFPFGVPGDKMSSVLEWNYRLNNLSEWGWNLRNDLDTIEKQHCLKSIIADINAANYLIERQMGLEVRITARQRTQEIINQIN